MAKEITTETFEAEVKNNEGVVLIDFWAEWCGPCQMLAPIIDELSQEYVDKATIGKLDVDAHGELASSFGVFSIPTVILFKNGEAVEQIVGVRSKSDYQEMIDRHL